MADAYYLEHINGMAFILPQMPSKKYCLSAKTQSFDFKRAECKMKRKGIF